VHSSTREAKAILVNKAYKFRIYPNKEQAILIAKTIGCSRFVFNHFLAMWKDAYNSTGKGLSYKLCSAMLPEMKGDAETAWLKEVDSIAMQTSLENLKDAYDRFFKKQNKAPRFKSKNNPIQSYTTKHTNGNVAILGNKIKLPKLGFVRFAKSREIDGRIIRATIRRNPSGKYFISILAETEVSPLNKTNKAVGIDLGITDFAILSTGEKLDNNQFTAKMEKKLKREQRKLSRRALHAKNKGMKLSDARNYQKQKQIVARLQEKVFNQRNDYLNKLSTSIIKNHDIVCIEDLNVKGMLRNHKLAKSISDVSWSRFVSKLEYKAKWYGRTIIKIDRWFPSSKLCSTNGCGHKVFAMPLSIRHWTCEKCHTNHDRDINASKNILAEGLRQLTFA
jgi:putative transposase